jgi:hypothetical protein
MTGVRAATAASTAWDSAQPRRGRAFGALPQPQVLDQADQHSAHQKGLVPVIAGVLDLEHHVGVQQGGEVQRVAALQEPAGGALARAGDPPAASDGPTSTA